MIVKPQILSFFPSAALTCVFFLFANFIESSSENPTRNENGLHQLRVLGTAGGITYYTEANQTMTWANADAFCRSSGLNLATVMLADHVTLLQSQLQLHFAGHGFWTAAREDQTDQGFVWNTPPNAKLVPSLVGWVPSTTGLCNCVIIYAQNAQLKFAVKPCANGNWLALCQSP